MDNPASAPIFDPMDVDIIIAGGGLNGASMALALVQSGFSVALADPLPVDRRSDPEFDGRSYALALGSKRLLSALELWSGISDVAQPILNIIVSDGRAGEGPSPMVLEFDHAEIEEGPMGFMVEDRHLRRHLLGAFGSKLTHLAGHSVVDTATGPGAITATLDDGNTITAKLLIGADGANSLTAQRVGIKRTGWGYDQTALVCAVAHERPHNGVAHQFFMPAGPLAILPLTGNRASIVWTEQTEEAHRINALSESDYISVLRPRFGDFLGEITLAGTRFTYPLRLSLSESFIAPRVALIGDAAHQVHPIAGQGLNAGLKDVATLAEVLTVALRRGEDFGGAAVLERYQSWRRFDVMALAAATDGFNRLFSNDNSVIRALRDVGLEIVNAVPSWRRGLMREAAGLSGELPMLLKGKPLL